jgi:hypothetical protein
MKNFFSPFISRLILLFPLLIGMEVIGADSMHSFPDAKRGSLMSGGFPHHWEKVKKGSVELSVPDGSEVALLRKNTLSVRHDGGKAWIGPVQNKKKYLAKAVNKCDPRVWLVDRSGSTHFFICGDGNFRQIVFKRKGTRLLATDVSAPDMAELKAMAVAASSVKPVSVTATNISLPLRTWHPQDRSFSIKIPSGWEADGGTADLGANSYVRIVQAVDPEGRAAFLGLYYPFYQFAQTMYGSNGIFPMKPESYIQNRLFYDLATQYDITFDDLQFDTIETVPSISEQLTQMQRELYRSRSVVGDFQLNYVVAYGHYVEDGQPYDLLVTGIVSYLQSPLNGMGTMYTWGPAPIFIEVARKGEMRKYLKTFKKMESSFQVDMQWLKRHLVNAQLDAAQTVKHYRKMNKIIHDNSEQRIRDAMQMHEAEETERMEEFWDTFYALGGEDRLDDPLTGEEIDLPTGADRYFFDHYSQSWVGIDDANPDALKMIRHLKDKGFHELKPHRH